jgi:hypothetical protein
VCYESKTSKNLKEKEGNTQPPQIPLKGMTKLGTRGPLLLNLLQFERMNSLFSSFMIFWILIEWIKILINYYKKRLQESWSSKDPTWGEESSVLAQNCQESPLFCDGPAKNQQTKLIRL